MLRYGQLTDSKGKTLVPRFIGKCPVPRPDPVCCYAKPDVLLGRTRSQFLRRLVQWSRVARASG